MIRNETCRRGRVELLRDAATSHIFDRQWAQAATFTLALIWWFDNASEKNVRACDLRHRCLPEPRASNARRAMKG